MVQKSRSISWVLTLLTTSWSSMPGPVSGKKMSRTNASRRFPFRFAFVSLRIAANLARAPVLSVGPNHRSWLGGCFSPPMDHFMSECTSFNCIDQPHGSEGEHTRCIEDVGNRPALAVTEHKESCPVSLLLIYLASCSTANRIFSVALLDSLS